MSGESLFAAPGSFGTAGNPSDHLETDPVDELDDGPVEVDEEDATDAG